MVKYAIGEEGSLHLYLNEKTPAARTVRLFRTW
jgi:hypothetical protein